MNVLFVSIDSLRKDVLSTYDQSMDVDVRTPNIDRFAERSLVFDTHYAGSLPCMPARREWMTGVQEFLWRPWGPIEPFDTTLPLAARENGVLSQLITDHFHYFQHGSDGYYEDYNGFEYVRGHEVDAWRTHPPEPEGWLLSQVLDGEPKEADDVAINKLSAGNAPTDLRFQNRAQYARNAAEFEEEKDFFAPRVFSRVESWLADNVAWDDWFLYVDSFDVHEPFHNPEPYASMYTDEDPRDPSHTVWPYYGRIDAGQSQLSDDELAFVQSQFAGKVTMVDRWFGKVLDTLDEEELWDETMVIVTSDHGFFLGEHGWIGKPGRSPMYDTLVHTPLMVWHPGSSRMGGRTSALTSAVDLHATVLDAFGVDDPNRVHSRSLLPLVLDETNHVRDWALYGYWGSSVNITDGERTYMRPCRPEVPSTVYSTTMMNAYGWFTPRTSEENAEAGHYLPYADAPVWRYEAPSVGRNEDPLLFDVHEDPDQTTDLVADAPEVHDEMHSLLVEALDDLQAPDEQYERLGL